ncbi:MAG TPA: condensation domain-containing protein, partial [Frankiaceae bacterium]|nr:condensation domain-containing protein [Frankiaceae bacterium]
MTQAIEGFRLSAQQRRLWSLGRDGRVPVCQCAVWLSGEPDVERLRSALDAVVARHEILRTGFRRLAGMQWPLQVIAERGSCALESVSGQGGVEEQLTAAASAPFDLERGPVLRARLAGRLLVVTAPAVCADAWSLRTVVAEALGGPVGEPPLPFVQFSEWEHELLSTD